MAGVWGEAGRGPGAGQGHTDAGLCQLVRGLSHPPLNLPEEPDAETGMGAGAHLITSQRPCLQIP